MSAYDPYPAPLKSRTGTQLRDWEEDVQFMHMRSIEKRPGGAAIGLSPERALSGPSLAFITGGCRYCSTTRRACCYSATGSHDPATISSLLNQLPRMQRCAEPIEQPVEQPRSEHFISARVTEILPRFPSPAHWKKNNRN